MGSVKEVSMMKFRGKPIRVTKVDNEARIVCIDLVRALQLPTSRSNLSPYTTGLLPVEDFETATRPRYDALFNANPQANQLIAVTENGAYRIAREASEDDAAELSDWIVNKVRRKLGLIVPQTAQDQTSSTASEPDDETITELQDEIATLKRWEADQDVRINLLQTKLASLENSMKHPQYRF